LLFVAIVALFVIAPVLFLIGQFWPAHSQVRDAFTTAALAAFLCAFVLSIVAAALNFAGVANEYWNTH
jgi:hypothetical protein